MGIENEVTKPREINWLLSVHAVLGEQNEHIRLDADAYNETLEIETSRPTTQPTECFPQPTMIVGWDLARANMTLC